MKKWNINASVFSFLSRIADLMILNVLWLIGCIPIITIGASTAALYECTIKLRNDGSLSVFKDFLQAFRANIKKATVLVLVVFAAIALLVGDIYILFLLGLASSVAGKIFAVVVIMLIVPALSYIFPLQAQFENTVFHTLKNAWIFATLNLPTSLMITFLNLLPIAIFVLSPTYFARCCVAFLTFGFSGIAYINTFLLQRVFAKYSKLD